MTAKSFGPQGAEVRSFEGTLLVFFNKRTRAATISGCMLYNLGCTLNCPPQWWWPRRRPLTFCCAAVAAAVPSFEKYRPRPRHRSCSSLWRLCRLRQLLCVFHVTFRQISATVHDAMIMSLKMSLISAVVDPAERLARNRSLLWWPWWSAGQQTMRTDIRLPSRRPEAMLY